MPINLKEKSLELKKNVSQYVIKMFLGDFSSLLKMKIAESDQNVITTPDLAIIFDDLYEKGLGFENEKNLNRKTSCKYMKFGF